MVAIDLILVSVKKLNRVLFLGIEIDKSRSRNYVYLSGGSELYWFSLRDRNWLGFSVGIEIDLVFVRGSKLTSFLREGRKHLVLSVGIRVDLGFMCGPKITGFSVSVEFELIWLCG